MQCGLTGSGWRPGQDRGQFVGQLVVEGLAGGEQPVPDHAEHNVGDGARRDAGRELAAGLRPVEDDREGIAAALQERGAETLPDRVVDLGPGAARR